MNTHKKYQRGEAFAGFVLCLAIGSIWAAWLANYGEQQEIKRQTIEATSMSDDYYKTLQKERRKLEKEQRRQEKIRLREERKRLS